MKTYTKSIILSFILLVACKTTPEKTSKTSLENTKTSSTTTEDSLIFQPLDTTIFLKGLAKSNYSGKRLTSDIAKKILYAHFESEDFYTQDNLPEIEKLTDSDYAKMSVVYDTIFTTELNGNKNLDAVITYWITPPYASGHCWQPHKAIIIDSDRGYEITNEEFIPTNFAIDSIVTKENNVTIFGYDYDCGNHKVLRNFRVKIK